MCISVSILKLIHSSDLSAARRLVQLNNPNQDKTLTNHLKSPLHKFRIFSKPKQTISLATFTSIGENKLNTRKRKNNQIIKRVFNIFITPFGINKTPFRNQLDILSSVSCKPISQREFLNKFP